MVISTTTTAADREGVLRTMTRSAVPALPYADHMKTFPHNKRVGSYLLGKTLGEGSFAKVKLGLHLITGEKVAIKVISKNWSKQDVYIRRNLRRETKLLHIARHPHIMTIYEAMETENSYYMVSELCPGSVMELITKRGRISERITKSLIRQLLMAVSYLHQKQIIHRDLKIENLLLGGQGNLKLIDFGLSNFVQLMEYEGEKRMMCRTQCGSPAYAAPELLNKLPYTYSADVWSIGVCMFAMLTGNLPYDVQPFNVRMLKKKIQSGNMAELPENISQGCSTMVHKLLTVDPNKRISVHDALNSDWVSKDSMHRRKPQPPLPENYPLQSKLPDMRIVGMVATQFGIDETEVLSYLVSRAPHKAMAMYLLLEKKLSRFGKNDYSSDNQPIPMKSNREEPPLRDLRSADLCTLPTSVVTPSIQLKESKQPLTDSGHGSAEDGPDTPDIQSVTVTELPPTKAITHSHPQAPKNHTVLSERKNIILKKPTNSNSVAKSQTKLRTTNPVAQMKGSLQRLYTTLSKDRSTKNSKEKITPPGGVVVLPTSSTDNKPAQRQTTTKAVIRRRPGSLARYKLRMPVIDTERQAVSLTSPRSKEKLNM